MQPNFADKTIWTGDNLDILRGMNSESVDLIYLDPPFNSNRNYSAPAGSALHGRSGLKAKVFERNFEPGFKLALSHKDLGLAVQLAASLGAANMAGSAAYQARALGGVKGGVRHQPPTRGVSARIEMTSVASMEISAICSW